MKARKPITAKFKATVYGLSFDKEYIIEYSLHKHTYNLIYNKAKELYISEFGKGNWNYEVYDVQIVILQ